MDWNTFLITPTGILICYLLLINLVTFIVYGVDKLKAKRDWWRIPEKTLLLFAIFGGSVGALLGMNVFHHKTLHNRFRYGIPVILIIQVLLFVGVKIWLTVHS